MNKVLFSSLLLLGLSFSAEAEDWTFFSNENKSTAPNYGLAGSADLDGQDGSGDFYGVELSFICPLVHASEHSIRQQVSLTKFHKNNIDNVRVIAKVGYSFQK